MLKISKLFHHNKKTLFLALGVGLFLSLLPLFFAQAAWWDIFPDIANYILTLPIRLAVFFIALGLFVVGVASGFLFFIVAGLMSWMVQTILTVGVTPSNPFTPQIIDIGWTFSRDFANMFFILALVFIGLSTILRIREYEAKKALPILIIIAVLINFTPVIVGFIVDMGNIITNFFIQKVGGFSTDNFKEIWDLSWDYLKNTVNVFTEFEGGFIGIMGTAISTIVYGIVIMIFFLLASLVYLLVTLVFFFRIIILWILMILSPIAFISKIFPATKETKMVFPGMLHWDEWWEKLIQWIIVGIPIGFFLYLSKWILMNGVDLGTPTLGASPQTEIDIAPFVELIGKILAPTVSLVMLIWGTMISLNAAPAGAKGIVNWAKKGGKWITSRRPVRLAMGAAAGRAAGLISGAARGARRMEEAAGKLPGGKVWSKAFKPGTWATRGAEMGAVPYLRKYESKARRVSYDEMFKGMEAGEMANTIEALSTKRDRVEAAAWMAEKGLSDKPGVTDDFKKKRVAEARDLAKDPHYQKSVGDLLESYTRGVTSKVMLDLDPGKAEELKGKVSEIKKDMEDEKIKLEIETQIAAEKTGKKLEDITKEDIAALKPEEIEQGTKDMAARELWVAGLKSGDVKDIEKKSFREDIGTRRGMRAWGSSHMSSLQQNFKKDVIDAALNNAGGLNAMFDGKADKEAEEVLEKLYLKNPRILNFLNNTPAGREWNWRGRQFLPKNKEGRPDFGAFVEKMEAKQGGLLGSDTEFKDNAEKLATDTNIKTLEGEAQKHEEERAKKVKEWSETGDAIRKKAEADGVSLADFLKQTSDDRRRLYPALQAKYESLEKEFKEEADKKDKMLKRAGDLRTIMSKREEEGKIIKAPSPLPEIQEGMPKTLRDFIERGRQSIKNIEKTQKELQRAREIIKDLGKRREGVMQDIGKLNKEIGNLDAKEAAGTITREETMQRTELRGGLDTITDNLKDLESQIKTQGDIAKDITDKILKDKEDLETSIREPVQDLMESWEARETPKRAVKEIRETYKKIRKK